MLKYQADDSALTMADLQLVCASSTGSACSDMAAASIVIQPCPSVMDDGILAHRILPEITGANPLTFFCSNGYYR